MSSVTLNGNAYSDAGEAARDMRSGGHRSWLLPMLSDAVVDQAAKQAAAALSAAAGVSTSNTSLAISTGSKTLTVDTGKGYVIGMYAVIASSADPTNRMSGLVTAYNSGTGSLTVLVDLVNGSGTFAAWSVIVSVPLLGPGKQTAAFPARALIARTTNGSTAGTVETPTNKVMVLTLDFDPATTQYAQFTIASMPKGWDRGTLSFRFVWSHPATTVNFGVAWAIRALATGNDDAIDAAFGTAVSVAQAGGTTNDQYTTDETAALTPAGSPAALDALRFELYRDVLHASDTLAVKARLEGVIVHYTTSAVSDA